MKGEERKCDEEGEREDGKCIKERKSFSLSLVSLSINSSLKKANLIKITLLKKYIIKNIISLGKSVLYRE